MRAPERRGGRGRRKMEIKIITSSDVATQRVGGGLECYKTRFKKITSSDVGSHTRGGRVSWKTEIIIITSSDVVLSYCLRASPLGGIWGGRRSGNAPPVACPTSPEFLSTKPPPDGVLCRPSNFWKNNLALRISAEILHWSSQEFDNSKNVN